jgi:hypothetical protein
MGIGQSVSVWLRSLGHDAIHLNDEGLFKLADDFSRRLCLVLSPTKLRKGIMAPATISIGKILGLKRDETCKGEVYEHIFGGNTMHCKIHHIFTYQNQIHEKNTIPYPR